MIDWDQDQQKIAAQVIPATQNMLKQVTTKTIYISRMTDLLVSPKVESKFPEIDFKELVYPRIHSKVLEAKQRDFLFSLIPSHMASTETGRGFYSKTVQMIPIARSLPARGRT